MTRRLARATAGVGLAVAVAACGAAPPPAAPVAPTTATAAPPPVARPAALPGACSSATPSGAPLGAGTPEDALERAEIARVELRGVTRVEASRACALLMTRAGRAVERAKIRDDIRRLWATSEFDDIAVSREVLGAGVAIVFLVRERPTVTEVTYSGDANASAIAPGELSRLFPTADGARLDVGDVRAQQTALRKAYVDRGYRAAKVDFEIEPLPANRAAVRFRIEQGPRTTIVAWRFRGNTRVREADLRALMTTEGGHVNAVGGVYRDDVFGRDREAILARYYDGGMLLAAVGPEELAVSADGASMTVTVGIVEGAVFKIKELAFAGQLATDERSYATAFAMKPGDVMRRSAVLQGMERLREMHRRLGAEAEITPETALDPTHATVSVTLRITRAR